MTTYVDLNNKGLLSISEGVCKKVLCDDFVIKASNNPFPNTLIMTEGNMDNHFEYKARFYLLNQSFLCKYNTDEINKENLVRIQELKISELEQIIFFYASKRILISSDIIISLIKKNYSSFENALEKNKELILNMGLVNISLRDYLWFKIYPKENKVKIKDFDIIL